MAAFLGMFGPYTADMISRAKEELGSDSIQMGYRSLTFVSTPIKKQGMSPFWWDTIGGVVCGYADFVANHNDKYVLDDVGSVLSLLRSLTSRYCGAWVDEKSIVLFTDTMAACRLFYSTTADGVMVFGSRARSLLITTGQEITLLIPGNKRPIPNKELTLFQGVYGLCPTTRLVNSPKNGCCRLKKTENRVFDCRKEDRLNNLRLAGEAIGRSLRTSVARCTQNIDRVAISLSGGVDSSAIASLATLNVPNVSTYTVGTPYGGEFSQAAEVAKALGTDHHELLMTCEDLEALLPDLFLILETWDPITLQIAAPLVFLYRSLADQNEPIFLTGYGADLLFAGTLDVNATSDWIERAIYKQVQLTIPTNEFSPSLAGWWGKTVRYPFWDPEVVRTAMLLPGRMNVHEGVVKYPLRKAAEGILPHTATWRTKRGIHEGMSIHVMFEAILGEGGINGQSDALRRIAMPILCSDQRSRPSNNQKDTHNRKQ